MCFREISRLGSAIIDVILPRLKVVPRNGIVNTNLFRDGFYEGKPDVLVHTRSDCHLDLETNQSIFVEHCFESRLYRRIEVDHICGPVLLFKTRTRITG